MFTDESPLGDARQWVRVVAQDGGDRCPCCTQFVKIYRRKIHASMARDLIYFYRENGREWGHWKTIRNWSGDLAKLRYWGLTISEPERREDGGRTGWWQITERGEQFVKNVVHVPKYVLVFNNRVLGFDGEAISISDAIGDRFDYRELMDGTPPTPTVF